MTQTDYGFTGESFDATTGLLYLRARMYSPRLGSFASRDPLETPNRYAYVGGNVVNRTDPSGLQYGNELDVLDVERLSGPIGGGNPPWAGGSFGTELARDLYLSILRQTLPAPGYSILGVAQPTSSLLIPSFGSTSGQLPLVDPVLQAIAQGQCLQTPQPSSKRCDPIATQEWTLRNAIPLPQNRSGPEYDYQRFYAGSVEWRIPTGAGENVDADGIQYINCLLIETKYIRDRRRSVFVLGSAVREDPIRQQLFITATTSGQRSIDDQVDDLFRRYGAVIRNPDTPFVGLEVITNEVASFSYWQFWVNKNNVPNFTIREGVWV